MIVSGLVHARFLGSAGHDFAEGCLILLDVVGEGEHELLSVFGAHDDAGDNGSLGHTRSCEDEVDEELVGAMADHGEVAVFTVGGFGAQLNLQLVLVFFVCHFLQLIDFAAAGVAVSGVRRRGSVAVRLQI